MTADEAAPRIVRDGATFLAGPWRGPAPADGWGAVFAVFASERAAAPPLLGRYVQDGEAVRFTPRFAPDPAVRLRAVFKPEDAEPVVAWFGGVPAPERAPSTRVVSVTPSAGEWPENVLRFYVTFSAPMRFGGAWEHIRMLDGDGRPMGGMFVEIDQELWDRSGQRLTVLFDPARIKRGLVDHINEGPPLTAGETVTLEIDALWRDASGALLAAPFHRSIAVIPPHRGALDPAAWRITRPDGPDAPLIVDFPAPLDAALALRSFQVRRGRELIATAAELADHETRLLLTPAEPWRGGAYVLETDPVLEDIAGNRLGRPFDIDATDASQGRAAVAGRLDFSL